MADRKLEGLVRLIDKRKAGDKASAETMIELGEATNPSGSAGAVPTCTVDGDDEADIFEPYGLAGQAASGDALLLAPGGDSDSLTALVSSVTGRPATEPGDKALWTAGGHVIYLDNDGSLRITSKDGSEIVLAVDGDIDVTPAPGAKVRLGSALASTPVYLVDPTVTAHEPMAQTVLAGAAAFLGLPVPTPKSNFTATKVTGE